VYLNNFRLTWIHSHFFQDWRKAGTESVEVLLRIKEHGNLHLVSRAETHFELKSWRGMNALLVEPCHDCVVLCYSH
jgi:hypothetical protein